MEIIYGAILNPFVGQMYIATKGQGAFAEDLIRGYRAHLQVSDNALSESMLIYDAGIAKGEATSKAIFNAFLGNVGWVRIFGVAVLDLPLIALGSADVLVSNIPKPMDIAPGCLLIEEAGGVITDFAGNPWTLHSKNIIAANKNNHSQALQVIQNVS
jgi:myo-inositol-1(or 4)-monophosphatase